MSRALAPAVREEEDAQLAEALAASLAELRLSGPAPAGEGPAPEPEAEPSSPRSLAVNLTLAVHVGKASGYAGQPASSTARASGLHLELDSGWEERLARAWTAGRLARRKLSGSVSAVPATPVLPGHLRNRVYAVVRGPEGSCLRGLRAGPWRTLRGRVEVGGQLPPEVVAHGFPSVLEAEEYWRAATGESEVPRVTSPTG